MPRADLNAQILQALSDLLSTQPELRFGQALHCLGIIDTARDERGEPLRAPNGTLLLRDPFHEEPGETLRRMQDVRARAEAHQAARRDPDPHVQAALHQIMHGVQHP